MTDGLSEILQGQSFSESWNVGQRSEEKLVVHFSSLRLRPLSSEAVFTPRASDRDAVKQTQSGPKCPKIVPHVHQVPQWYRKVPLFVLLSFNQQ